MPIIIQREEVLLENGEWKRQKEPLSPRVVIGFQHLHELDAFHVKQFGYKTSIRSGNKLYVEGPRIRMWYKWVEEVFPMGKWKREFMTPGYRPPVFPLGATLASHSGFIGVNRGKNAFGQYILENKEGERHPFDLNEISYYDSVPPMEIQPKLERPSTPRAAAPTPMGEGIALSPAQIASLLGTDDRHVRRRLREKFGAGDWQGKTSKEVLIQIWPQLKEKLNADS